MAEFSALDKTEFDNNWLDSTVCVRDFAFFLREVTGGCYVVKTDLDDVRKK